MKITPRIDRPFPTAREPKAHQSVAPTSPASSVTTEISDEAREKSLTASGKNTASPAQRARELNYTELGFRNFGGLVSALARGIDVTLPQDSNTPEGETGDTVTPPVPPVDGTAGPDTNAPPTNEEPPIT